MPLNEKRNHSYNFQNKGVQEMTIILKVQNDFIELQGKREGWRE